MSPCAEKIMLDDGFDYSNTDTQTFEPGYDVTNSHVIETPTVYVEVTAIVKASIIGISFVFNLMVQYTL